MYLLNKEDEQQIINYIKDTYKNKTELELTQIIRHSFKHCNKMKQIEMNRYLSDNSIYKFEVDEDVQVII